MHVGDAVGSSDLQVEGVGPRQACQAGRKRWEMREMVEDTDGVRFWRRWGRQDPGR